MSSDNVTQHVEGTIATVVVAGVMYGLYWLYKGDSENLILVLIGIAILAILALVIKFWKIALIILACTLCGMFIVAKPMIAIIILLILILASINKSTH